MNPVLLHVAGAILSLAGVILVGVAMLQAFAYVDDQYFTPHQNLLITTGVLGPVLWAVGRVLRVRAAKERKPMA